MGSNVFVTDGSESFLLYGSSSNLSKGDKISGYILGKAYLYNTLREFAVSDWWANITVDSSDNTVTATSATIGDIVENYDTYEAAYVKLSNVYMQAEAVSSKYLQIADESGDDINIYDTAVILTDETYSTEDAYNVYCYVVKYKGTVQVYVLDTADIVLSADDSTNIAAVAVSAGQSQMFNLAGQRVSDSAKGIVIVNGKKVLK